MEKKVLSEIDLYFSKIKMPEGFEIDREKLSVDIFQESLVATSIVVTSRRISSNLLEVISLKLGSLILRFIRDHKCFL